MTHLSTAQIDRACGVLVGSAVGDALGAGYEFQPADPTLRPAMIGGGLGDFEPGEWTDDTAQSVAIALVAAEGLDLRTDEALDRVAQGFADWFSDDPADVGIQTRSVLTRAGRTPTAESMRGAAQSVHAAYGRSAGNGSLMRTGPVALAYLDDPSGLVEAAMAVSALTHVEDVAQEACAVWCLMIRHAVLTGELPSFADVEHWTPNAAMWRDVLAEAEAKPSSAFTTNSWSVGALQAAWSAIVHTPIPADADRCRHFADSLATAIRIGGDTDTVAAIAGALLGGRWGMTSIPATWRRHLHGWPGMTGKGLEKLAYLSARGGRVGKYGWPRVEKIDYGPLQYGLPALSRHPHDDGVWLASATALDDPPEEVDAVVSLCLTGSQQVPDGVEHLTFRLMDHPDAEENPNLDFVLADAASAVASLRDEGKRVLVHCVASHSRTPAVGAAYSLLLGVPLERALREVCEVLPAADPNAGFRAALNRLAARQKDSDPCGNLRP